MRRELPILLVLAALVLLVVALALLGAHPADVAPHHVALRRA